jgi:hypothetical protein
LEHVGPNTARTGRYDAELDKDGKAFRPDGKQAGTLIPPAFGLAGVNLATWTGFGSVTYWNAYVAGTEMHGAATFFDARFNNKDQYPVAAKKYTEHARQGHRQTGRVALLSALNPGAEGAGRVIRQGCIRTGEDGLQRLGEVRNVSRAAAPLGTRQQFARSASTHSKPIAPRPTCTARHR